MTVRLVSLTGAESVQHPELGSAAVGDDGVFDVSDDLGAELVKQRSSWVTEVEHIAAAARKELEDLADPTKVPEILQALRAKVNELEARVEELLAELHGKKAAPAAAKAAPAKAPAKKAAPAAAK